MQHLQHIIYPGQAGSHPGSHFVDYVFQSHVETLEDQVKEQEAYHKELQEIERWLLQMSSRMVTPDPTVCGSLESATQQLASHKVNND